jgi:hypothetical protein
VSCGFSREKLALHVGGDLPAADAVATASHLSACDDCRRFLEELRASQAVVKSSRAETASSSDCAAVRRQVMAIINERPDAIGWPLRLERAFMLGLRPSYALAAFLVIGMVSASVLAQIRPAADIQPRPDGYRDWTLVSGAVAAEAGRTLPSADRVFVSQSSYQAYERTGIFPEGTVFVWEAGSENVEGPHSSSSTLLVSLKDSARFEGGWGFFDFSGGAGTPPAKARALPDSKGCRACHLQSPLSVGA